MVEMVPIKQGKRGKKNIGRGEEKLLREEGRKKMRDGTKNGTSSLFNNQIKIILILIIKSKNFLLHKNNTKISICTHSFSLKFISINVYIHVYIYRCTTKTLM